MRIGLNLPQGYFNEFDGWEPVKAWRRILEIAELGAQLGFESLWTGEHVLSKWGGPGSIAFDFYTLATAIAVQVPRVEIGFGVVNSTFHNPALMAKMMATLDVVSGGRVVLGLGAGFKETEALAFGFDYPALKDRLAILAEHFEIVTRMLNHDEAPFSFEGRYARVREIDNQPRGVRRPRVKIMVAGRGPNVTFRLAAKYADALNLGVEVPEAPEALAAFRRRCEEIGRDPSTIELQAGQNPSIAYRGLKNLYGQRMMLPHERAFADPEVMAKIGTRAEDIAAWRDLGMDELVVAPPGLHNSDETLYELIEDIHAAGVEFPRPDWGEAATTVGRARVGQA
ncbi:MAG TPA: LLM class flavin-dependent oxidoreductase [Candidatus Saccharimonadales bacterium]|nr:LLM class flavin-dependent oxidoreductase [Candidatus Saccharimonadales bacterium]